VAVSIGVEEGYGVHGMVGVINGHFILATFLLMNETHKFLAKKLGISKTKNIASEANNLSSSATETFLD
jgi:hypothetical protein